uniref:Uncharacterized protein n=1 Tax=Rhizophora mucronata TaxID=61149 RepID=A0A2P2N8V2_RHIMU
MNYVDIMPTSFVELENLQHWKFRLQPRRSSRLSQELKIIPWTFEQENVSGSKGKI